jgi:pimeloyl-ACP methyl ester carboxylesterase
VSSIVTEQGVLHFEAVGRGRPLLLLHGWINSWDVWREAMLALAGDHSRRVYALDFWGFGDSSMPEDEPESAFHINSFVEMVRQFMDHMGIDSAPIAGHSMGGTVALRFAIAYPERVERVIVVGSPIDGTTLNPFLKLAGYGWIAQIVWRLPFIRTAIMRLLLARDSDQVQRMISRDLQRTSLDSFFRSIGDLRETDLRGDLDSLHTPTLGIFGRRDNIVSPVNADLLSKGVRNSHVTMMERSRHFPMSDEPQHFVNTLTGFLNGNGQH